MVMVLWWCAAMVVWCYGGVVLGGSWCWRCYGGVVVVVLWWCGSGVLWWCGMVVLWWYGGGVLWWCGAGGAMVVVVLLLWWCGGGAAGCSDSMLGVVVCRSYGGSDVLWRCGEDGGGSVVVGVTLAVFWRCVLGRPVRRDRMPVQC